jgi:hypothetical protein
MERIKNLNGYQKTLIIIMIVAVMVFSIIYPKTISRVGFRYNNKIFVPTVSDDGSITYSGRLDGKGARFVVSADKNTVEFCHGDDVYGIYSVVEDASAIPKSHHNANKMTGIEIRDGEEILFRGGVYKYGSDSFMLYSEKENYNSTLSNPYIQNKGFKSTDDTTSKPNAYTVLALMGSPELTHKGSKVIWFSVSVLCLFNALSMIFFNDLFRFDMFFQVRDPESAEPSDFYIMSCYIAWTLMTISSVALFIFGLQ